MKPQITDHHPSEVEPLLDLVRRTARWLRASWVATGLALSVGWLFSGLAVAAAADMLQALPTWLRLAALVLIAGSAAALVVMVVVWPLCRRLTPVAVARRIESHIPRIHNRLVTCVDLAGHREQRQSAAFYHRLVDETLERVRGFGPSAVLDQVRIRQAGIWLAGGTLAMALLLTVWTDRFTTAERRILFPLADIAPATGVHYVVIPGDTKLLRGDPLTIAARMTRGTVARLRLELRPGGTGHALAYDLQLHGTNLWQFNLSGFERSFEYRVVGGGTWSPRYRVTVLERPAIEELHTVLHYPAYLGRPEPLVGASQVAEATGPEGSEVEVVAQVKGSAVRGELQQLAMNDGGGTGAVTNQATTATVTAVTPMHSHSDGRWSGKVLLTSNIFYRVEFRDELGHPNLPMRPARLVAVADQPPQVSIERPGTDLVLSQGGKVPLVVAAYDDLGLADVRVLIGRTGTNGVVAVPFRQYSAPTSSDTIVTALDLSGMNLKDGEVVRYQALASDRKGQVTQTKEFLVRIAAEDQAADRRLEQFTAGQDAFARQLARLLTAQAKVQGRLKEMSAQYAPLMATIAVARAEIRPAPGAMQPVPEPAATNAPARAALVNLDPASAKKLEELRAQLDETAGWERANTDQARQFAQDWSKAIGEAAAMTALPAAMTDQMRLLEQSFAQMGLAPMQGLAEALRQGAQPQTEAPDLEQLRRLEDRLEQGLSALASQLGDLNRASDRLQEDPGQAMAQLATDRLLAESGMATQELRNLEDQLGDMLAEMKRLENEEQRLADTTPTTPQTDLPALEAQQAGVEQKTDPLLDFAQALQAADQVRPLRRPPTFPMAPYAADHGEYFVPPAEEDTPEPAPAQKADEAAAKKADHDADHAEEEPTYTPLLGGPQPKLDPRFADKRRPVPPAPATGANQDAPDRRDELESREWHRLQELNLAQQSVGSDQHSLDAMARQLEQAAAGAHSANSQEAQQSAQQLAGMMQAQALQRAMAMAARMKQGQGQSGSAPGQANRPSWMRGSSFFGGGYRVTGLLPGGDLPGLDVTARTVILGLQPQLRDELLQGMREDGPEAYRQFIQNYFKQLTKVKGP